MKWNDPPAARLICRVGSVGNAVRGLDSRPPDNPVAAQGQLVVVMMFDGLGDWSEC